MFRPLQKLLFTLCWFLPVAGHGQVALNLQTPKFTGRYKRELPKYKMDSSTTSYYFRQLAVLTIKMRKMQTGPPFPSDFVDWLVSRKKNGLQSFKVFNTTTVACHLLYRIGLTNTGKTVTQPFPLRFIRNPEDFISDHTMVSRLNTNQRADAYPWLSAR